MKWWLLLVGYVLRFLPPIRGRHRLQRWWIPRLPAANMPVRLARTPSGSQLACSLSIPYEAMVWLGREEWDDLHVLSRLEPGQVFVDAGANIGLWSLEAAQRVGPSGEVHSFEANPATAKKLGANVALNGFDARLHVHACALSDNAGTVLLACETAHNLASITDDPTRAHVAVSCVTLDSELPETCPHGMKIDVEGHELAVLHGASQLIARARPWIVIEFNPELSHDPKLATWPPHGWLVAQGYRPFALDGRVEIPENFESRGYLNLLYLPATPRP